MSHPKPRFDVSDLLGALEATSTDLHGMSERITGLEAANYRLDEENTRHKAELAEAIADLETAKADAQAARRGAELAEQAAESHGRYEDQLRAERDAANDDLSAISRAVSALLAR